MTTENSQNQYERYPQKYILPYDGMAINAGVWIEAHNYHNQLQNAHQLFLHGAGIVAGLEVVASDPPDHIVFVLPGVAIDSRGQMIILAHPVAYDLGERMSGKLHLYLLHREIKVQADQQAESNLPAYMQNEFVIVARAEVLDVPHVELARIFREDGKAPICDADDAFAPQKNAIDLRYRQSICPPAPAQVQAGVCYLGKSVHAGENRAYDRALIHLAQPLAAAAPYRLIVENNVPLNQAIFDCGLVYLVVGAGARLDAAQAEVIGNYLQEGGKLLVEFSEAAKEEAVKAFFQPLGVTLRKIVPPHPLFEFPHLFLAPPQGSVPGDAPALWYSETGILCSTPGCGAIWSGAIQPPVTRECVREMVEWGVNLLNYLLAG